MRNYEELVKRLREADEKSMCGECGLNLHSGATKKGVLFAEAADAIEELSREKKRLDDKVIELQAIADHYEAASKEWFQTACEYKDAAPKWISAEERLPEFDQKVLAWVKNKDPKARFNHDGIYIAELKDRTPKPDPEGKKNFWGIPGYDSEWTVWAWSYFSEPEVTHWMPLPEPPTTTG